MLLKMFAELPPRKRIGIIAIILGIAAAIIGDPCNTTKTSVSIKEVALKSSNDVDAVKVEELAGWIIEGKMDYRLVDLRDEDKYSEYNIPTSENIKIGSLMKSDLKRNEKIILYSDKEVIAAQGWFILKADDYKSVAILSGGMDAWKDNVVFPTCSCGDTLTEEEKQLHQKKDEVAKFFGGQLETGSLAENEKVKKDVPKLKSPAKIELKQTRRKKKREGC